MNTIEYHPVLLINNSLNTLVQDISYFYSVISDRETQSLFPGSLINLECHYGAVVVWGSRL